MITLMEQLAAALDEIQQARPNLEDRDESNNSDPAGTFFDYTNLLYDYEPRN